MFSFCDFPLLCPFLNISKYLLSAKALLEEADRKHLDQYQVQKVWAADTNVLYAGQLTLGN